MPPTKTRFVQPSALMAIRNMELRARVVVEGFWSGLHRSPFHGFSVEFTEYRQYSVGDDTRYIDWRLAGRTDRYYVKKFEDETNLRCYFLVDQSQSMAYGSGSFTKAEYAATLAATLGYFLELQGDAIGLLTFAETLREYLPARHRPGHLRQFTLALEKQTTGRATNLDAPLRRMAELVRKRGLVVMISDFLTGLDSLEKNLAQLRAWGHEVALFQILDPAEWTLQIEPATIFRDLETGQELYIDPAAARKNYRQRMEAHHGLLQQISRALGISLHQIFTDAPLETTLLEFLLHRRKAGRALRQRTRAS